MLLYVRLNIVSNDDLFWFHFVQKVLLIWLCARLKVVHV